MRAYFICQAHIFMNYVMEVAILFFILTVVKMKVSLLRTNFSVLLLHQLRTQRIELFDAHSECLKRMRG